MAGMEKLQLAQKKQNTYRKEASIIGKISNTYSGRVIVKTRLESSRIVDMLSGELLLEIC